MKKTTAPTTTKPVNTKPATAPVKTAEPIKTVKRGTTKEKITNHLFDNGNYKWMLIGLVVIAIGFIVMGGGKSGNPNVFLDKDVYSFRRITIAPILIIAGFIIEIYAIMRKPAARNEL